VDIDHIDIRYESLERGYQSYIHPVGLLGQGVSIIQASGRTPWIGPTQSLYPQRTNEHRLKPQQTSISRVGFAKKKNTLLDKSKVAHTLKPCNHCEWQNVFFLDKKN